jgi:hypothetical protein
MTEVHIKEALKENIGWVFLGGGVCSGDRRVRIDERRLRWLISRYG